MSKKWRRVLILIIIILLLVLLLLFVLKPQATIPAPGDLLGRWRVTGDFTHEGGEAGLLLQVNQLRMAEGDENTYLGVGCMQSEASGGWAPLSLQAVHTPGTGSYTLNLLSTLVDPGLEEGAAVIRLVGEAEMGAAGMKNDRAGGTAYLAQGEAAWSGTHTSLEMGECPEQYEALSFHGEFGVGRDLAFIPPWDISNFQGETNIASLQMQIDTPDGRLLLADYHTGIFTPEVNFIDRFSFQYSEEGAPISDQPYHFSLLDALGEALPGVTDMDAYRRCEQGAATYPQAQVILLPESTQIDYVELAWQAPEIIPDYFDLQNGHGMYQVVLEYNPWQGGDFVYGAEVLSTLHRAPWQPFEPGAAGFPDGHDYGISWSELEDGEYILFVASYSYYEPAEGETGFDCRVTDTRHALLVDKQGEGINIQPAGAISGFIYDAAGEPQAGVAVQIKGLETGFFEAVCSRDNGYYVFTRLPLDSYEVSAGGFGAEDCPPNDMATVTKPEIHVRFEAPVVEGVDFTLAR